MLLIAEEAVKVIHGALVEVKNGADISSEDICKKLLYGAHLCGQTLHSNAMGIHHKIAHILGGKYSLPHAEAHTVILPHSIDFMCKREKRAREALCRALNTPSPAETLWDLQYTLGVPVSLRELKFTLEDVSTAADLFISQTSVSYSLGAVPLDPKSIYTYFLNAYHGSRPTARAATNTSILSSLTPGLEATMPVSVIGRDIKSADWVVICIHGRFSSATRVMKQFEDIVGKQYEGGRVALIAPQAPVSAWYPNSFLLHRQENEPSLSSTLSVIDACVTYASTFVPMSRIMLFGFSQGACSVLTYLCNRASDSLPLAAVFALSGGPSGSDEEIATSGISSNSSLRGVRVVLGVAEEDAHVPQTRVQVARDLLSSAGATVQCDFFPGTAHKIYPASASKVRCVFNSLLSSSLGSPSPSPSPSPFQYSYLSGYMSSLESEALDHALPRNQRSPRDIAYGLIAEVITGSPFCAPRNANLSTWFYRIHPSVGTHGSFAPYDGNPNLRGDFCCPGHSFTPEPVRWNAPPHPASLLPAKDFVDGLVTLAGTGNPMSVKGMAIHTYAANKDMVNRCFYNSDGDLLLVPELGSLNIQTEFGLLYVSPGEIFILPKGLKMTVCVPDGFARGFVAELFEIGHFQLPNLGPLGSNGLADARHFKVPKAYFEDRACDNYEVISKFGGSLFLAPLQYSPYDVVAWSGRYHPCKYDLIQFMAFGSVTWDHADPSLHTVLTCPIDPATGASACDIVCFRPRFDSVKHTFRPPYYHRNCASEFNAIIEISSPYSGFDKGVHWLTPTMSAHGIAGASYNGFMASPPTDEPMMISEGSIWIMFESIYPMVLTDAGANSPHRDLAYREFFKNVPRNFSMLRESPEEEKA
jgi:homogentisate 1,2-dioxygenase